MNPDFWRGKRVFLTGHTGFKGSWLTIWLHRMGAEVSGFALAPATTPNLFELARLSQAMVDLRGDVRNLEELSTALNAQSPDIVIHMAAQAIVRQAYAEPVENYATNIMGTVHLLEAVRRNGQVRAVIIVTSDKCYQNQEWAWGYREDEPMGGHDPYSSSKACAELVTAAYRSSYLNSKTALASVRAGNVIGGGDWAQDRLLPDMIRAAMKGNPVQIRNPDAIRPWQHVLEPLSGYLMLAERLYLDGQSFAQGWNFGPSDEDAKPVRWIADWIAALWSSVNFEVDRAAHPHEAHFLKLDSSRARGRLGWRPRLALDEALSWTVRWYQAYQNGADMRVLCNQQIDDYCELTRP